MKAFLLLASASVIMNGSLCPPCTYLCASRCFFLIRLVPIRWTFRIMRILFDRQGRELMATVSSSWLVSRAEIESGMSQHFTEAGGRSRPLSLTLPTRMVNGESLAEPGLSVTSTSIETPFRWWLKEPISLPTDRDSLLAPEKTAHSYLAAYMKLLDLFTRHHRRHTYLEQKHK